MGSSGFNLRNADSDSNYLSTVKPFILSLPRFFFFLFKIMRLNEMMTKLFICIKVKSLRRVQLCDPTDCSPPGSSLHGIFQARILEWVAIPLSRASS